MFTFLKKNYINLCILQPKNNVLSMLTKGVYYFVLLLIVWKKYSFEYILMNSPILIFLNSAFKCSTKLSTSLPRINHHKGFRFILQSPTSMFIVLGWTLSPPQVLVFCTKATGNMSDRWVTGQERDICIRSRA